MCALALLMTFHHSCQPSSVRRVTEVTRYVSAQDQGGNTAIVIEHYAKFIDEVVYPGREKITPLKDELRQVAVSRSGERVEQRRLDPFYLEPHPVIIDAGVIENQTYLLDLDDRKFSVIRTAPNGKTRKIFIGFARMVYYQGQTEVLYVDEVSLGILNLKDGSIRPVPQNDQPAAERASKIAIDMQFSQSMCLLKGKAYFASIKIDKKGSWRASVVDLADTDKEVCALILRGNYTDPGIKMTPYENGGIALSVYGLVEGEKFRLESFRIIKEFDDGRVKVEPAFDLEL